MQMTSSFFFATVASIALTGDVYAPEALRAADVAFIAKLTDREPLEGQSSCPRFRLFMEIQETVFGDRGSLSFAIVGDESPLPIGAEALVFAVELEGKALESASHCIGEKPARIYGLYGGEGGLLQVGGTANARTISATLCKQSVHPFVSQFFAKDLKSTVVADANNGRCTVQEFEKDELIRFFIEQKKRVGYIAPEHPTKN
jgi:hypothetical protein